MVQPGPSLFVVVVTPSMAIQNVFKFFEVNIFVYKRNVLALTLQVMDREIITG